MNSAKYILVFENAIWLCYEVSHQNSPSIHLLLLRFLCQILDVIVAPSQEVYQPLHEAITLWHSPFSPPQPSDPPFSFFMLTIHPSPQLPGKCFIIIIIITNRGITLELCKAHTDLLTLVEVASVNVWELLFIPSIGPPL